MFKIGKCSNCKKPIQYNKFKRYRGKVLCYDCYDTRLERKKQKKEELEKKAQILSDNTEPDDSGKVELKYDLTDDEDKTIKEEDASEE